MLNIFAAMVEASASFHEGDLEGGAIVLDRTAAAAADFEDSANGGEGDVDIQLDLEMVECRRGGHRGSPVAR